MQTQYTNDFEEHVKSYFQYYEKQLSNEKKEIAKYSDKCTKLKRKQEALTPVVARFIVILFLTLLLKDFYLYRLGIYVFNVAYLEHLNALIHSQHILHTIWNIIGYQFHYTALFFVFIYVVISVVHKSWMEMLWKHYYTLLTSSLYTHQQHEAEFEKMKKEYQKYKSDSFNSSSSTNENDENTYQKQSSAKKENEENKKNTEQNSQEKDAPSWYTGDYHYYWFYSREKDTEKYNEWYEYITHPMNMPVRFDNEKNFTEDELFLHNKMYYTIMDIRFGQKLCPWQYLVDGKLTLQNMSNEKTSHCSIEENQYRYLTKDMTIVVDVSEEYKRCMNDNNKECNRLLRYYFGPFRFKTYQEYYSGREYKNFLEYLYDREQAKWYYYEKQKEELKKLENPYYVLGIEQNASVQDIKKAYRKLIKQVHPDVVDWKKKGYKQAYDMIQNAYDVLMSINS